ncbi:MAG TPA: hypothetical protein VLH13_03940, partial [Methanomassiliicoccales archaeon]|nr:hypothetical protein [Methanomassiliicoccales archaeon]
MNAILSEAQMAVQRELKKIDALMQNASMRLSPLGLNGTLVREELNSTFVLDPYLMNIITYDRHGVVMTAVPSNYLFMEGMDLSYADNVALMLTKKMPIMTDVLLPLDGNDGAVLAAPVFDEDGLFVGAVSALFSPSRLMNGTLPQLAADTGFTFWCMQSDGIDIYDTDASQIGMNIINGTDYQDFPEVQAIGRRMVNETSGYGTYSYLISLGSQTTVEKECYWTTVGAHGIAWRLAVVHRL